MSNTSKLSEAINLGNASVNAANATNAADPNNPGKNLTSKDWVNATSGAYGYLDNLAQIGGKNLPLANQAAAGSAIYSLGYDIQNTNTVNTSDLLGLSGALLGMAAAGIATAGTAPVWVPIAVSAAAFSCWCRGNSL
ncbi:hypothetical protein EGK75_10090 [Neisseria weixii]|uniref:Uncharacterized protein n=1 Tax=Neisseria weixii TaxID=1853276 RepID=A0A3N4NC56_9NEIS|nr:hypothetical protein [Neisseria weixii]RPD84883.1 hypothetical protein EGK74_10215 [Neisseria weixii]RPD85721.1 hypothetical protein EGK75_10090 [Neisseria weixii]